MCSLHANTINFFYSSLYFLLKHITLSYGGFNTVSKLYGGDPCSALLFPGASLIMQYHNSLHSRSLLGSTSCRDYQTAQPHNTIRRHKKKQNKTKPTNVHPEQFSPPRPPTLSQILPHARTDPQECTHVPADATK